MRYFHPAAFNEPTKRSIRNDNIARIGRFSFRRKGNVVELLIVGNHDEIVRLLRQL
jgi:hypothetical protein